MKTKTVQYYDLFDHSVMTAKNKLEGKAVITRAYFHTNRLYVSQLSKDEKEIYYQEKASHTKCECHHYTPASSKATGGMCVYRTCRHDLKDHP